MEEQPDRGGRIHSLAAFSKLTDIREIEEPNGAVLRKVGHANLFDIHNNHKMPLQADPKNGYTEFSVVNENSPVVIHAKVIKINTRDLIFQGSDNYYRINVGETIKDALTKPLSKEVLAQEKIVVAPKANDVQKQGK